MYSVSATRSFTLKAVFVLLLILFFSHATSASESLVNINNAGVSELAEKLSGIGPAKAKAIVDYRNLHGPFTSVEELINVKGIGPRTLEKIRLMLSVKTSSRLAHDHHAIAANASGGARAHVNAEHANRQAVRSVIEAARRSSSTMR